MIWSDSIEREWSNDAFNKQNKSEAKRDLNLKESNRRQYR